MVALNYEQRMNAAVHELKQAMLEGASDAVPVVQNVLRLSADETLGATAGAALMLAVGVWGIQARLSLDVQNELQNQLNAAVTKFFSKIPNATVNVYDNYDA